MLAKPFPVSFTNSKQIVATFKPKLKCRNLVPRISVFPFFNFESSTIHCDNCDII